MARFGIKEVADVIFYDLAQGGKPVLFLDSLKMSNLENDAETTFVQGGRGNARILSFDYNRTASFALQDALMNPRSLAMQAGTEVIKGVVKAHKREVLDVASGTAGSTKVELQEIPIVGSMTVYTTEDGYDHIEEIVPSAVGQTTEFSDTDAPVGQKVVVFYQYETGAEAERVIISSDKFSGFYKIVGLTVAKNASNNREEAFEIEISRARIASNWSINLTPDGDPAVFDMNLEVLKPDDSTEMIKITRLG